MDFDRRNGNLDILLNLSFTCLHIHIAGEVNHNAGPDPDLFLADTISLLSGLLEDAREAIDDLKSAIKRVNREREHVYDFEWPRLDAAREIHQGHLTRIENTAERLERWLAREMRKRQYWRELMNETEADLMARRWEQQQGTTVQGQQEQGTAGDGEQKQETPGEGKQQPTVDDTQEQQGLAGEGQTS